MFSFLNGISLEDILIQLIGFAAMLLVIISYQAKKRTIILLIQILSSTLWAIQFLLLGGITGAALNILAIIRALIYMQKDKYAWTNSLWLPIGSSIVFVTVGIITYESLISILPMIAMVIASFALFVRDERKIRLMSLGISPPWLIYDAFSGSVAGVISEVFTICSIIIALIRYRKKAIKCISIRN